LIARAEPVVLRFPHRLRATTRRRNTEAKHRGKARIMPIQHFPPPPGIKAPPLSYAARVGNLLYISGIPGFDEHGVLPESFEAQFGFVAATVKRVLADAGTDVAHLVKINVLLTRASDVAVMNQLYATAFGPAPYPARTTCVVHALPHPSMLIEIEGVASVGT
jgi:enamine deaminase RidA (YjgF/YER057c/UK114 family)